MAKKLPDGEHREYYEDRSLKAVYTIKDGKKDGAYTEYEQNSNRKKLTEEYSNGELHGKRVMYSWGEPTVIETYEHGTITERRWGDEHYETYKDGQLYHVVEKYNSGTNIDMYYKDGKEYEGIHHRERFDRDGDHYPIKYTVKEGKYHGEYLDALEHIKINYDMGVLHGPYIAIQKDGSIKEGEYNHGQFTGTIEHKDGKTIETWVDGKLDCTTTYASAKKDRYGNITPHNEIISEIRPNGACFEKLKDGRTIKYEQKNGKKDGKYEEFDPKGWLRESSVFENGKLKEKTEFYSDGNVVTKDKDNTSDGEHREYYEDRKLKAVYTLKDGTKDGIYTEYPQHSDTPHLTEEYSNGELHGKRIEYYGTHPHVTETYEHGTITERRWSDEHYETYKDGQLYHVVEKDGSRTDIDMYYKDGKEYEGTHYRKRFDRDGDYYPIKYTVKEGKYHGEYLDALEHIKINYDMGVLHGPYIATQKDGSIKEGEYNHGQFTGIITSKDRRTVEHIEPNNNRHITVTSEDGKVVETWNNGELLCTTTYESAKKDWFGNVTEHGKVVSEIRPNGTCVEYLRGQPIKRYEQKDGKKEGKYEELDPRGWVKVEAQYKNGELNGFYKEYNSDGTVASRRYYKDGKDITPQRNMLVQAAKENVQSTEGVAPRQSKLKKTTLAIKMKLAGLKKGKE